MDFRAGDFVVGLAPLLAEAEAGQVIDSRMRGPALAQIALADGEQAEAAIFLGRVAAIGRTLVLRAEDDDVVVGAVARLAAEIDVADQSTRRVILRAVGEI